MKFQRFFDLIEDAPNTTGGNVPRCFLHFPVAQQENVEFGSNQLHCFGERQAYCPALWELPVAASVRSGTRARRGYCERI